MPPLRGWSGASYPAVPCRAIPCRRSAAGVVRLTRQYRAGLSHAAAARLDRCVLPGRTVPGYPMPPLRSWIGASYPAEPCRAIPCRRSAAGVVRLPGASVPGYPMPPLRGWSGASTRRFRAGLSHAAAPRLEWCVLPGSTVPGYPMPPLRGWSGASYPATPCRTIPCRSAAGAVRLPESTVPGYPMPPLRGWSDTSTRQHRAGLSHAAPRLEWCV